MRRPRPALAVAALAAGLAPAPAAAETLLTLLSTNRVEIHSTYAGDEIVVFGTIDSSDAPTPAMSGASEYRAVIVVTGPRSAVLMGHKSRVGPIWLNRDRKRLLNVPGYLAVLSSGPLGDFLDPGVIERLELDPRAALDAPAVGRSATPGEPDFRDALIRIKSAQNLYRSGENAVSFMRPSVFQARIDLPANAPLGRYFVATHVFRDGAPVAESRNEFFLTKTGFEAVVASEARNRPWIYGLGTVLMALFLGWLAGVAFRRD
jgi:uncharacterized protein (TIGR02186 family)